MIEPTWHFELLDVDEARVPVPLGRLTSFQPVVSFAVGRPVSATMLVRNEDPLVGSIIDLRSRIKAYRVPAWDDAQQAEAPAATLRAYNIVTNSRDVFGTGGGVQLVSADPSFLLDRRERQAAATYTGLGGSSGVFAGVDQGSIVKTIVDDENLRASTFIRTTTYPVTTGVARTLTIPRDKKLGVQIGELATSFGGFEFDVVPIDDDPLFMGDLRVSYPAMGVDNPDVFVEHGLGQQNVTSGERIVDPSRVGSHVHVLGRTDGASQARVDAVNQPVADYYRTILDTSESYGDIADPTMLGTLSTGLTVYQSGPRELLRLELADTAGIRPFDDFNLGDRISARIREGRVNIDGTVRVWGFEITPLPTGEERLTALTIAPEGT